MILLTGASGYLGSRVASALQTARMPFKILGQRLDTLETSTLRCDIVIHCAGALRKRPQSLFSTNTEGTKKLMRGLAGNCRVVFISSGSVYSPLRCPPTAEDPVTPATEPPFTVLASATLPAIEPFDDYGRSKLLAEQAIIESGKEFVIFRSGALFGHPRRVSTFPDQAVELALGQKPISLAIPDRDEDYLDVDFLSQVIVSACANGSHWGKIFNIAGPRRSLHSIIDALAHTVNVELGHAIDIHHKEIPVPKRPLLSSTVSLERSSEVFSSLSQPTDESIFTRMLKGRLQLFKLACDYETSNGQT